MSVAPETLLESQTRVESQNLRLLLSLIMKRQYFIISFVDEYFDHRDIGKPA